MIEYILKINTDFKIELLLLNLLNCCLITEKKGKQPKIYSVNKKTRRPLTYSFNHSSYLTFVEKFILKIVEIHKSLSDIC